MRRLTYALLVLSFATLGLAQTPATPTEAKPQEKQPSADEIMEKYIKASGGREAFGKLKNMTARGSFSIPSQGLSGNVRMWQEAPNKTLLEVEIGGMGTEKHGCDGKTIWAHDQMNGPRILKGVERDVFMRENTLYFFRDWKKHYTKAEMQGIKKLDDKPCYKLELTPKAGKKEHWYIGTKDHLLVMKEATRISPMGEMVTKEWYSAYKKIDGVTIPQTITQELPAMRMKVVVKVKETKHNVDMKKDRFALPDDIKKLLAKQAGKDEKKNDG